MTKSLNFIRSIKTHRNLLSALVKESKYRYFNEYFEDNWNNMKNT